MLSRFDSNELLYAPTEISFNQGWAALRRDMISAKMQSAVTYVEQELMPMEIRERLVDNFSLNKDMFAGLRDFVVITRLIFLFIY